MWTKACPECNGTGHKKVHVKSFLRPMSSPKPKTCPLCKGKGEIRGRGPFSKPRYTPEEK